MSHGGRGWSRAQAQSSQVFFQLPGYTPSQEHLQGSPKVCAVSSPGKSSKTHPLHVFSYFPCHAWAWLQRWLEDPEQLYKVWAVCAQVLVRLECLEGMFVRFPDGFLICIPRVLILPLSCVRNFGNKTQLHLSPNLGYLSDEILTFPQPCGLHLCLRS